MVSNEGLLVFISYYWKSLIKGVFGSKHPETCCASELRSCISYKNRYTVLVCIISLLTGEISLAAKAKE